MSMPIGRAHRSAAADRSVSEASAARAELAAVRFDVQEMADSDLARTEAIRATTRLRIYSHNLWIGED